jgi:ribosomal-protein-alanine N-acetyltransferase
VPGSTLFVPTLTSERLILEPLSLAHSAGMFSMWRERDVCRFSGPVRDFDGLPIALPAENPADSDRIIDFFLRSRAEGTRLRWALITRDEGRFVGATGFNSLGSCSDYAYHLHPGAWGRGLMSEASGLAIGWLRDQEGSAEVEAFIHPDNRSSIKLCSRLGFQPTGEIVDGAVRYRLALQSG